MEKPEKELKDSGFSQYGKALRSAGPLFGSGIQLAASVVLMFFAGRWLDSEFNTYPWLMLLAIFFGLGAGLYNFVKIVNKVEKNRTKDR
ncbi:MAG: AtpZ/AtpI family protein [Bacteroidota bacterium]|nr:AtpZ/AtpI family protein [Bacteroidota bacterium]